MSETGKIVVTPISLILSEFIKNLKSMEPDWSFQFDPTLTYETSIRGVRAVRSALQIEQKQTLPLFTYNIAPVIPWTMQKKQFDYVLDSEISNQYEKIKGRFTSIGISFKIYFGDVVGEKTFESLYVCDASINELKEFTVDLPRVGTFRYWAQWENLEEVTYQKDNNHYTEVSGKLHVYGEMITLLGTKVKTILKIRETLKDLIHPEVTYLQKMIVASVNSDNN